MGHGARTLFPCNGFRRQTPLTAGRLRQHPKLPLTTWLLGTGLISQAKTGLSALAPKRLLGVSYPTAWLLHQKINPAMATQDATHQLSGAGQRNDVVYTGSNAHDSIELKLRVALNSPNRLLKYHPAAAPVWAAAGTI